MTDILLFILIAEALPFCAALALALYVARQRRINAMLRASLYPYVEPRRSAVRGSRTAHGATISRPSRPPGGDSAGGSEVATTRACGYAQTDFENVTGGET